MSKIAFINNKFLDFNKAYIHIEDRGLQFADSVYEVIAVYNMKFIDFSFHLNRLKYSINEININYKVDEKKLNVIFKKLIEKNSIKNGLIYLQITRGVQSRSHAYNNNLKPTIIIYTKKKQFNLPGKKFKGITAITHKEQRWERRDIKTVNLLPNILAENLAIKKNASTAIFVNNGKITEGVSSNIWIIKKNKVTTHPSNHDILTGITRTRLKILIKDFGLNLKELSFTLMQMYEADEVFLTSSSGFITPILKIDSKSVNNGRIGNITLKLATLYSKSLNNE